LRADGYPAPKDVSSATPASVSPRRGIADPARQLTSFTGQSVRSAAWSPDGTLIAFTADTGGDEQTQVCTIPAAGGDARLLSGQADREFTIAEKTAFGPAGRYLLGGGNDQDPANPALIIWDLHGDPDLRIAGPRPGITYPVAMSPDGRHAVAGFRTTNVDHQCCLADLRNPGQAAELLTGDLPEGMFYPGPWKNDSSGFYLRTTPGGDRTRLAFFDLAGRTLVMVDAPGWDVDDVSVSADGSTVIWSVNEDGRSVLYGLRDGSPLPLPIPG